MNATDFLLWFYGHSMPLLMAALLSVTFWRCVHVIDDLPADAPKRVSLPWLLLAGSSVALACSLLFRDCADWLTLSLLIFISSVMSLIPHPRP